MANPNNVSVWLKPATPGDPTMKQMKERPAWWSTSIGGAGTIGLHWMGFEGEIKGTAQVITVSQETGIMGLPGIVVPLTPPHPQSDLATNQGDPRATWIEIVALTGSITWGRYGLAIDSDGDGRFLKGSDSHLTYTLPVGTSLRIGPCPDPDLGVNGAVEVDDSGIVPLPTGAATSAKQDTGNTSLASIDTKLTAPVSVELESSTMSIAGVGATPKFAVITASSSGATTLVAAVTSKKIRVLSYVLVGSAAVNAKFQSHVTPTDKTGLLYLAANTGVAAGYSPVGHFETIAGEALDINLSGSVAVGGHLTYLEV